MTGLPFVFASMIALAATPAVAEPVTVDFTARSINSSQVFMTGEADGLFHSMSVWDPAPAAAGPMAGLQGPCFGAGRIAAGHMSGDGYCAYKDSDGNTAIVRWWMDNATASAGAWVLAGGTGKWATATGGGLWSDSPGEAANVTLSHITGLVDMK